MLHFIAYNPYKPPAGRIIYAVLECLCYMEKMEFGRKCRLRRVGQREETRPNRVKEKWTESEKE